ncbi:MAG TPA: hypothetical protein VKR59_14065 [Terriglobales bacterium]|nr:hypothetical protein [Terriglobales bacterium]
MSTASDKLMESFAAALKDRGVPIREEDNASRLRIFEEKLPKRLPQSFQSFLCRYSFPAFDVMGIALFGWDSDSNAYVEEASAAESSSRRFPVHLSEFLIPAGYVQIGRPDGGDFDAICFEFNQQSQNREYRIVQVDHEGILCNSKVRVSSELWGSFVELVESALSSADPQIYYEDPIV